MRLILFSPIALASSIFSKQCFVNRQGRLCNTSGNNKMYLRYSVDRPIFASTYLEIKHKRNIAQLAFTSVKSVKEMRKICSNVLNDTPEQLLTKMTCYGNVQVPSDGFCIVRCAAGHIPH